ncbi:MULTISPECIES: zf-HC2 domain-containing protein [Streptomyces]|uniref:RNA polymerase subunit sigma n=1 Tax=Streptomyces lycii TaxID=2654337 RepID=A0ABQ7FM23_9ACTN|nr:MULTISPECIES: zf-HC2 domain-containing protein [Streptomyces]KAF4409735.1 RNA polymerase subunit sigma [Streptomyces lycii]PGH50153.1 RNA polymerase subunit sigma [Streptomyces sp. Ru87]
MTAPGRNSEHEAVGAYALGILDPADAARFETHLAGCNYCSAQLDEFMGIEPLLATLAESPASVPDPAALHAKPSPQVLPRLLGQVSAHRRKARRRGRYLLAAVAAVVIGGPSVAVWATSGDSGGSGTEARSAEEVFRAGMAKASATDPVSKVSATVGTEKKAWGTDTVLELKNVKGPEKCSLVAVSKKGNEEIVTSWSVPDWGYGVPGSDHPQGKDPLYVHGGSAMTPNEIDHFEVRTFDGKRLVTVES